MFELKTKRDCPEQETHPWARSRQLPCSSERPFLPTRSRAASTNALLHHCRRSVCLSVCLSCLLPAVCVQHLAEPPANNPNTHHARYNTVTIFTPILSPTRIVVAQRTQHGATAPASDCDEQRSPDRRLQPLNAQAEGCIHTTTQRLRPVSSVDKGGPDCFLSLSYYSHNISFASAAGSQLLHASPRPCLPPYPSPAGRSTSGPRSNEHSAQSSSAASHVRMRAHRVRHVARTRSAPWFRPTATAARK